MSEVVAALERHARERGDEVALHEAGRAISWSELRAAAATLAALFGALGASARVMVVARNGAGLASAILAALAAEVELLGAAPGTPAAVLGELATQLGVKQVFSEPGLGLAGVPLDFNASPAAPVRVAEPPLAGSGAILLTTSGTTGMPRIARRSSRAVDFIAASSARALGLRTGDRSLLAIPLYHSYGLDQFVAAVIAGATVELHAGFNPASVRLALFTAGVTHLPAVPTMLDALARLAGEAEHPPRLRCVVSAGSVLPERVARAFAEKFRISAGQVYGSSELGTVAATQSGDPFGCVGRALPGADLRILDREAPDPEKPLAQGAEGLVAVASPSRFDCYVDAADPNGEFVMTGDLGRLDAQSRLWLTGRASLLIDVGAVKVNPLEVEMVLMRHPGVREAVVLPLAFSATASRLRAVIVPEPGREPSTAELRRFAREQLIDYKVPRAFEIRADVPRSPTGKILRGELLRDAP